MMADRKKNAWIQLPSATPLCKGSKTLCLWEETFKSLILFGLHMEYVIVRYRVENASLG